MSKRIYESARALAEERGVDPDAVEGTGKGGAVTKADVERYIESGAASPPSQQEITRRGLAAGLTNEEIVAEILEVHPDSKVKPSHVAWTIGNERRRGTAWWREHGPAIAAARGVRLDDGRGER